MAGWLAISATPGQRQGFSIVFQSVENQGFQKNWRRIHPRLIFVRK
jgi:hypothetical protein